MTKKSRKIATWIMLIIMIGGVFATIFGLLAAK